MLIYASNPMYKDFVVLICGSHIHLSIIINLVPYLGYILGSVVFSLFEVLLISAKNEQELQ